MRGTPFALTSTVRMGATAFVLAALLTASCGMPRDPEDSLERILRTGVVRAGIAARPPWTEEGGGPEADVVNAFAQSLGARVEWRRGSDAELFEALETFELDLAVGGFTGDNPWGPKLGLTRPYVKAGGRNHVIAVAPGENRLLVTFERVLRAHAGAIAARVGGEPAS